MRNARTLPSRKPRGFVLIASLFMLIILTVMAVSMYRNFTIQENVAANTKEKGRAFQMAQSTLRYAEYELVNNFNGFATTGSGCDAAPAPVISLRICSGVTYNIQMPTENNPEMALINGSQYQPATSFLYKSQTGGTDPDGSNNGVYYDYPSYYVQVLGTSPDGQGTLYQITALAYGGNVNSVAAVQSTYELISSVQNRGGL
jgi:type IV pilus assembly protein PilX